MSKTPIIALTAILLATGPAWATVQDASASAPQSPASPETDGVNQVVLAAQLAAWGRRRNDAEALRLAARMLEQVPLRQSSQGDVGETPVMTAATLRQEADSLERRVFGSIAANGSRVQDEDTSESYIERMPVQPPPPSRRAPARPRQPAPAPAPAPAPPPPPPPASIAPIAPVAPSASASAYGVASSPFGVGPVSTIKRLGSMQRWGFEVDARSAEILRVAAIGDGDTNVDLIVSDLQGRVLCDDRLGDHYPVCSVPAMPVRRIRIDIVNRGPLSTKVQVLTN